MTIYTDRRTLIENLLRMTLAFYLNELPHVSQSSYNQGVFAEWNAVYTAMEFTKQKDNACSLKEKLKRFDNQLSEDSTGYFTAVEKTVETYLLTQLSDKS